MDTPIPVVPLPEAENSYLEHEVQNVYNLSKPPVAEAGHLNDRQMVEMEKVEKEEKQQPSVELQTGFKILKDLMADSNKNVNWPFMEPIEVSAPDLAADYHQKIEKPIWFKLMKEKFQKHDYTSITEFVSDFRLMLENCYRYNGPDHYVSKRGQKLETMLEQKLALLSRELRAKTSIAATSGHVDEDKSATSLGLRRRQRAVPRHDSTLLLNQLREEELQREREYRRQVLLDRKAEKEALALEIIDWEDKILFEGKYKEQMKSMWELPQIGLFLFLCQGPLNIGEIMQLELERCIMVPRESSTMHLIMTSLLSTPFQRQKIDKKTVMSYKVWNAKLQTKLQQWYKIYADSGCDAEKACIKLGFEPDFFTIVGQRNPMERKKFHELNFYRRVWIVKGLCDYCMQTQDYLRETVEIQPLPDQREYMLGTDADGWRYLHFPQFCGADVRIYRQAPIKYPKLEIKPDPFDSKRKFPLKYKPPPCKKQKLVKKKKKKERKHTPPPSPVARLRPAGLRQTIKTVMPLQHIDSSTSSTSEEESEYTAESQEEMADNVTDTNEDTNECTTDVKKDRKKVKRDSDTDPAMSDDEDRKSNDENNSGSDATIPYCDNSGSESIVSSRTCSRASSPCSMRESVNQDTRDSMSQDTMFPESSRENSPMVDDHMLRKLRKGPRLKDLPNSRAARNLNSFLFTEDSNSKSSDFGESSNSGIPMFRGKLDLKDILLDENSSSTPGDNSNSCDMKELFKNSSINSESSNSAIKVTEHNDDKVGADTVESMDTSENENPNLTESETRTSSSNVAQTELWNDTEVTETSDNVNEKDTLENENSVQMGENENKENIDACNVSTDQLFFKNANGFISRPDSLMQEGKLGMESREEESNSELSKSENESKIEVTKEGMNNVTNSKIETHSDVQTVEKTVDKSDTDISSMEETRELGENSDRTSNDIEPDAAFKSNKGEIEDHRDIAIDNLPPDTNVKADHSENDFDEFATSQTQNAQITEKCEQGIQQEIEDDNENYGFSIAKIEKTAESSEDVEHQTLELKPENNADTEEMDKSNLNEVKTEINKEELENIKKVEAIEESRVEDLRTIKSEVKGELEKCGKVEEGEDSEMKESGIVKTEDKEELENCGKLEENVEAKVKEASEVKKEIKEEIKEEKEVKEEEEEEEEEVSPDMESFKLIVDSVEGLRELTKQFEEPEPIVIKRGKKEQIQKPPPRKRCVVLLHSHLEYLLKELEPWEAKLNQATKRARIRLRKEVEDYVEKEEEEPNDWNTDEETESGSEASENGNEADGDKRSKASSSPTKSLKGRHSECSTPVKFEENSEDIDISQRGRLRKRRIIPNNIEDQNPVKKSKVSKSDSSHQPVLVQKPAEASGKITIGYSELIRQLKAVSPSGLQGTNSPILLQTSQGGKLLVTSIVPTGSKANTNIQNITPVSKSSPTVPQLVPITIATTGAQSTVKQSQHPTIQHLLAKPQASDPLSANAASTLLVASSGLRHILPQTTTVIQGVTPSVIMRPVTPAGNQQTTPVKTPIILKPNTTVTPQKLVLSYSLSSQKIPPAAAANSYPVISQQVPVPSLSAGVVKTQAVSVSPRFMALSASSSQMVDSNMTGVKGKVKYYAANASTLPINVVQQLLATRGAKLQTGPNQQSILFIPMETEGGARSVIPVSNLAAAQTAIPLSVSQTQTIKPSQQVAVTSGNLVLAPAMAKMLIQPITKSSESALVPSVNVSHITGSQTVNSSTKVVTMNQSSSAVSLPVPTTVSVLSLSSNSSNSSDSALSSSYVSATPLVATSQVSLPVTQILQIQTESGIVGMGASSLFLKSSDLLAASGGSSGVLKMFSSPPKYPTNETVRTLLFKRKSSAEEKDKGSLPSPEMAVEKSTADQKSLHGIHFQKISPKPPSMQTINVANPVALQQLSIQQVPLQVSPNQNLVLAKTTASPVLTPLTVANQVSPVNIPNTQQCVLTTISASKLNTLLLQTSAAGAKSIPSLIKLPSKAALDSAVKAVVTSVNVTLPTVNIKVPSPVSLPSIGPRRNVTKTIQTMKSPIPVAPKVITQSSTSSTGTALSLASSSMIVTTSALTLGSVSGQVGGLSSLGSLSNLIPAQQIQSPALSGTSVVGQQASLSSNLLQAVRAQLGSTTCVSSAGGASSVSSTLGTQTSLQTGNLVQSVAGMVQNIDGKNVLTKMIPQNILTSQGLVQGFITPQGIVIPQAKKIQTGSQVVSQTGSQMISQTGTQLAPQATLRQEPGVIRQTVSNTSRPQNTVSPVARVLNFNSTTQSVTRPNITPAVVQYIKPGTTSPNIAAQPVTPAAGATHTPGPSGAPLLMPVSQLKSPALGSASQPSSSTQKSPHQQTNKFIFPPNLSAVSLSSTQASASPMLNAATNLPVSGLIVSGSGGVPLASPLLNQLGFPLVQPGMAVQNSGVLPQNLNLASLNPSAIQQLVNPVLLTPGMVSPQLLNQGQGLQLTNQNLQIIKGAQLSQNNLIQLSNQIAPQVPKTQAQCQTPMSAYTPDVNNEILKQISAAGFIKPLGASQGQTKVNAIASSSQDVNLQQQLSAPSNLAADVSKQIPQLQGPYKTEGSQGNVEGSSTVSPQQDSVRPMSTISPALKPQKVVPHVAQLGVKTIAVNQITNKVVNPVCTSPALVKQTEVPNRVIAINKRSNKLEEVFPEKLTPATMQTTLSQGQNKPVAAIQALKSPETVQNVASGSQQKIMLFSIGGQLVTQQGVPVTLENGVLKLMPQAIVQIANQTLTPKQIQQTLAKISQTTLPATGLYQQGNLNQVVNTSEAAGLQTLPSPSAVKMNPSGLTTQLSNQTALQSAKLVPQAVQIASQLAKMATPSTQIVQQSTQMATHQNQVVSQSAALGSDNLRETQGNTEVKNLQKSSESIMQPAKKRSGARIPLDEQLQDKMVTVPNITTTGPNNVQFVLKPMVTSGYIVCPQMTATSSQSAETEPKSGSATGAGLAQQAGASLVNTPSGTDSRTIPMKNETKFNVNGGDSGDKNNDHSDSDDTDDESHLVIDTNETGSHPAQKTHQEVGKTQSAYNNRDTFNGDNMSRGSFMDKEAALNLLRLANVAVGSSDEGEESYISKAGDAANKMGR